MSLRLLIIDDQMPEQKYGLIEEKFSHIFDVTRFRAFNDHRHEDQAIETLVETKYDAILLDCDFYDMADQGLDILDNIRNGFARYVPARNRGVSSFPPEETRELNKDTPIIGVSSEWSEKDSNWREITGKTLSETYPNFTYVSGESREELVMEIFRVVRNPKKLNSRRAFPMCD